MASLFRYPKRKLRKMVKNGDFREALEFGNSIEEKFSQDPDFLFIMGSIYYMLENADNAIHYFDRALAINNSDTETLLLKANVHAAIKEFDDARQCCNRILEIDPDHNDAKNLLKGLDDSQVHS